MEKIKLMFASKKASPGAKYSVLKQEMMALRGDNYAIFKTYRNGMHTLMHETKQPLDTDFQARLIAGALIASKAYAKVVVARRCPKTGKYFPLKIQPSQ